ncbi:dipeptidyl-peptidase 5 [Nakamurella lactea]|uniref:dipeptidyl-peptidase 5 n=1 Tax=Nakamurella lactea TaxID=459515 RepID=UPI0003FF4ED6|nr:prolyl oligopeptidase family serine peptidase [Nakamurella lactea]
MSSTPTDPKPLPYGSWPSPIDTELLTSGSVGLSEPAVDERPDGRDRYWLESRPSEKGRTVLVRSRNGGPPVDVTPAPFNVRSSVHEYGGGAYAVADSVVVFSNFADGRIHLIDGDDEPRPITPDLPDRMLRYADLELDLPRRRLLAVREDHRGVGRPDGPAECVNSIVRIALDADVDPATNEGEILVDGHDFVSSPRLSPDGHQLAFYTWEHPSMPWDASRLWCGDADAGDVRQVDGGAGVSIADIGWLADGRLAWCSDRSGFWNLHVDGSNVYPVAADCADPAWVFGARGWIQLANGTVLIRRHEPTGVVLVRLEQHQDARAIGGFTAGELAVDLAAVGSLVADGDEVVAVAGFRDRPNALVRIDGSTGELTELRSSISETVDPRYFSIAEPINWPTPDGAVSHGFFYPPVNPEVAAPIAELPPLIVLSHGGPTGASSAALSLSLQYWTSRGFAVLDVNYGGSTGYGRAYRERLTGQWGIVDVDDCCSGAAHLVAGGAVDGDRLAIRGGSAGGYTTLAALTFRDAFAAGVSRYGIGDLEALATDTHKFESRYLDGLVGQYPAQRQIYLDRSPIQHVDRLDCALLVLQGTEDKVVPPNQSISMADAVRAKGRPVALRLYEGEGHGFRMAESVRDAIESELVFYGRVFGFRPVGELPELDIDNLPR